MEAQDITQKLQEPFPASEIEWRVQRVVPTQRGNRAIVVPYVTNRAIMNRLDIIFGVGGWKNEYQEWRAKGVKCGLSIKVAGEWITKWDASDETDFEGTKGGFSGAMKRAAVQFGIGRYLYDLDEVWVDIKDRGDNFVKSKVKIDNRDQWIKGYYDTPILPEWALPKKEQGNGRGTSRSSNVANRAEGPTQPTTNESTSEKATESQLSGIRSMAKFKKLEENELMNLASKIHNVSALENLTGKQAGELLQLLNKKSADEIKALAHGI